MVNRDDRYLRELRRNELGRRMLRAGARNCVVTEWTALTERRIVWLKAHDAPDPGIAQQHARRGPPPKNLATFFKTPTLRNETSALAVLFEVFGVTPVNRRPVHPSAFIGIGRGELLCNVWDLYPEVVEHPRLTFEHMLLLAVSLGTTAELVIASCEQCGAVIVVEHWQQRPFLCSTCSAKNPQPETGDVLALEHVGAQSEREPAVAIQRSLF